MNLNTVVGGIVALLGLGGAIQNFFNVPLIWKLLALTVSAILVSWSACRELWKWARPKQNAGFGSGALPTPTSRLLSSAVLLGLICALFSAVALVVLRFNTIRIEVRPSPSAISEFWIHAALQGSNKLSIPLPPQTKIKCAPLDPMSDGNARADALLLDWSSLTPQIQITNFFHPQTLGIRCAGPMDVGNLAIRVDPPSTEVFVPSRARGYQAGILSVGGVLWIGLLVLLLRR